LRLVVLQWHQELPYTNGIDSLKRKYQKTSFYHLKLFNPHMLMISRDDRIIPRVDPTATSFATSTVLRLVVLQWHQEILYTNGIDSLKRKYQKTSFYHLKLFNPHMLMISRDDRIIPRVDPTATSFASGTVFLPDTHVANICTSKGTTITTSHFFS
jgi:hypothetical protein